MLIQGQKNVYKNLKRKYETSYYDIPISIIHYYTGYFQISIINNNKIILCMNTN